MHPMYRQTILLIDDEDSIVESLSLFLTDEGYEVLAARSGETGLRLFFKEKVDLVITDLRMPGLDGLEVMQRIQQHAPDIPMVVISGAGKREDIIRAMQMGAKDYITKPILALDEIRQVVKKALENKALLEENKRYRRQLEKNEARYRTITEQIAEGVFTVDEEENITFCNPAFCRMIGYTQDELRRMNLKDLAVPDSSLEIKRQTQERKTGAIGRYEVQMIGKSGETICLELACSPIQDDSKGYAGAITVARDITRLTALRAKFQKFLKQEERKSEHIVSICANCKRIRGENNLWYQVEDFFSQMAFSHGICPSCCKQLYPEVDINDSDF